MKKIIVVIILITGALAVQSQSSEIASRILHKMRDSLLLNVTETNKVDSVNQVLHAQKMGVRQQHSHIDSLTKYTQRVERTRDSLYQIILPENKYFLYREKKRNLISNN